MLLILQIRDTKLKSQTRQKTHKIKKAKNCFPKTTGRKCRLTYKSVL